MIRSHKLKAKHVMTIATMDQVSDIIGTPMFCHLNCINKEAADFKRLQRTNLTTQFLTPHPKKYQVHKTNRHLVLAKIWNNIRLLLAAKSKVQNMIFNGQASAHKHLHSQLTGSQSSKYQESTKHSYDEQIIVGYLKGAKFIFTDWTWGIKSNNHQEPVISIPNEDYAHLNSYSPVSYTHLTLPTKRIV